SPGSPPTPSRAQAWRWRRPSRPSGAPATPSTGRGARGDGHDQWVRQGPVRESLTGPFVVRDQLSGNSTKERYPGERPWAIMIVRSPAGDKSPLAGPPLPRTFIVTLQLPFVIQQNSIALSSCSANQFVDELRSFCDFGSPT